jgi:potassium-transporting ATPase potassium-binding subunit
MSLAAWLQLLALVIVVLAGTRVLGPYIAKVYADGGGAPGDRFFLPIERLLYRFGRVDPDQEQPWPVYARAVLAFSLVSVLGLYALQRLQGLLPLNPTGAGAVNPMLALNTATSFVTNTNWQNYAGESTMSHLVQMAGLTVQNFVSAAVGIAVAIALVRGLTRRQTGTIGNFWVDLVRTTSRVLLPLAVLLAITLAGLGVVQTLRGPVEGTTVEGAVQTIYRGPIASQEAIKELGTNGGGIVNANSAHPFENPSGLTNLLENVALLLIPFALTYAYGRLVGNQRQGWALFAAMFVLWIGSVGVATYFEVQGNPRVDPAAANMEGKEVRFGAAASALFAASTTGTSTGAVISSHDSFTPGGGAVPLVNILLGEVSPGGVGAGLYGVLIFALLAVFISGLMVGRTPEYLGKRIEAAEMKLVVLYILVVPVLVLVLSAASLLLGPARESILNPGSHGLSEVVYAFASQANNNGSAFAGLRGNTTWYNGMGALAMLAGRFLLIIPVLAIAGSLGRKQAQPLSAGTLPTDSPLFVVMLLAVIVIVVGLTYFPALALGPIVEQLGL